MYSRMNKREIDFYYPSIILRDGEYCRLCGQTPKELTVDKLEIHEIRYERPLRLDDMVLLCHGCNNIKSLNRENIIGGEELPTIFKMSRDVKLIFKEWISTEMQNALKDGCNYDQLVADASLYTGMSIQTIKNWLYPLWRGKTSPYIEWGGQLYLRGRQPRGKIQNLPIRDEELSETDVEEMK